MNDIDVLSVQTLAPLVEEGLWEVRVTAWVQAGSGPEAVGLIGEAIGGTR